MAKICDYIISVKAKRRHDISPSNLNINSLTRQPKHTFLTIYTLSVSALSEMAWSTEFINILQAHLDDWAGVRAHRASKQIFLNKVLDDIRNHHVETESDSQLPEDLEKVSLHSHDVLFQETDEFHRKPSTGSRTTPNLNRTQKWKNVGV